MPFKASMKEFSLNDYPFGSYLDLSKWNLVAQEFASVRSRVASFEKHRKARVGSVLTQLSSRVKFFYHLGKQSLARWVLKLLYV